MLVFWFPCWRFVYSKRLEPFCDRHEMSKDVEQDPYALISQYCAYHCKVIPVCFFLSLMIWATVFFCGCWLPRPSAVASWLPVLSSSPTTLSSSVKTGLSSVSGSEVKRYILLYKESHHCIEMTKLVQWRVEVLSQLKPNKIPCWFCYTRQKMRGYICNFTL